MIVGISKPYKNADSKNPLDFIYNSEYDTMKIEEGKTIPSYATGKYTQTDSDTSRRLALRVNHGYGRIPFCMAYIELQTEFELQFYSEIRQLPAVVPGYGSTFLDFEVDENNLDIYVTGYLPVDEILFLRYFIFVQNGI